MNYYKKIDGLRFVAIFLVLLEHFAGFIGRPFYAGFYGVDLFFVISGFLITSILIKPNQKSFKENYFSFLGRRSLRIFPIYYLTLLLLWALNLQVARQYILFLSTFTFNYALVSFNIPTNPVNHFWSLSVEEQFYLFWPIAVLVLRKRKNVLILILLFCVLLAYAQLILNIFPSQYKYNYYGLLTRMGALGLGALGAFVPRNNKLSIKVFSNRILEYSFLVVLLLSLIISFKLKMLILGLCSFYLILKSSYYDFNGKFINQFLSNKSVVYIGTISYGIYIYHLPIDYYVTKFLFNPVWASIDFKKLGLFEKIEWHSWIFKFPIYSGLSILIASLSFKYIEQPILALKSKFFR